MEEITALLFEIFPNAIFEEIVDNNQSKEEVKTLSFSQNYISKILGVEISENIIEEILKNYKYEFKKENNDYYVTIPQRRLDLHGAHDMAEEIGRVYGYENIKPTLPKIDQNIKDDEIWTKINIAKQKLTLDGYKEVMTSIFADKGDIEILASASNKNFLRTNISDGIKKSYEFNKLNLPLLDIIDLKIFEIGSSFTKDKETINVCFSDKKGIKEMSLDEFVKQITNISEINEIPHLSNSFKPWSVYPFISRDVAVWLPEGEDKDKLKNIFIEEGTDLLIKEPYLFDQFTKPASTQSGNSKTSYAYRLVFQSYDRTLSDEEVNKIMEKINTKINKLGWEVR